MFLTLPGTKCLQVGTHELTSISSALHKSRLNEGFMNAVICRKIFDGN